MFSDPIIACFELRSRRAWETENDDYLGTIGLSKQTVLLPRWSHTRSFPELSYVSVRRFEDWR